MDTFSLKDDKILFWKTWPHMKYKWSIERHKQRNMIFDDTIIDKAAQSCNKWDDVWIIILFEKKTAEIYGSAVTFEYLSFPFSHSCSSIDSR